MGKNSRMVLKGNKEFNFRHVEFEFLSDTQVVVWTLKFREWSEGKIGIWEEMGRSARK